MVLFRSVELTPDCLTNQEVLKWGPVLMRMANSGAFDGIVYSAFDISVQVGGFVCMSWVKDGFLEFKSYTDWFEKQDEIQEFFCSLPLDYRRIDLVQSDQEEEEDESGDEEEEEKSSPAPKRRVTFEDEACKKQKTTVSIEEPEEVTDEVVKVSEEFADTPAKMEHLQDCLGQLFG